MVGVHTSIAHSDDNWQTLTNVREKKGTVSVSCRWIHTIPFGPTFASVLKVTKMRPNVGENTFRGRTKLVHIVSVWSTALASVGER